MKIIKHTKIVDDITKVFSTGEKKARFDFGTFFLQKREKGVIINSQTGKEIKIAPYVTVSFKASKRLKRVLNEKHE